MLLLLLDWSRLRHTKVYSGEASNNEPKKNTRKWIDPESPEKLQQFSAMLNSLGNRTLAVGPLDGRNSTVYPVGNKKIWKVNIRRKRKSIEDESKASMMEALLAAVTYNTTQNASNIA